MPAKKRKGGKSGIYIKPSRRGSFSRKAKARGMSVSKYASKVLRKGSGASAATRRQANFARNARRWNKGK